MTLSDWLRSRRETAKDFASGVSLSPVDISRALKASEKGLLPSHRVLVAIFEGTDGEVTPNDFFGPMREGAE